MRARIHTHARAHKQLDKQLETQARTHTHTHTHSVGLPCRSDQRVAQAATYTTHTNTKDETSMPSVEFEPAVPRIEPPQTRALDRTANGIGIKFAIHSHYKTYRNKSCVICVPSSAGLNAEASNKQTNTNRTANHAIRYTAYRLYLGVLYSLNLMTVHSTRRYVLFTAHADMYCSQYTPICTFIHRFVWNSQMFNRTTCGRTGQDHHRREQHRTLISTFIIYKENSYINSALQLRLQK